MGIIDLLSITGPIGLIVIVGYAAVRGAIFDKPGISAMAKFVVTFALPMALFRVLASQDFTQVANIAYLTSVAIGSGTTFLAGLLIGLIRAKGGLTEAALFGMGSAMSNGIMIGIPVTVLIFGEIGPVAVAMMLLVQSAVLMSLAVVLCDIGQAKGKSTGEIVSSSLKQVGQNPIIIAIALGLAAAFFQVPMPALLTRAIDMFAATAAGLGLFVIGGLLAGSPVRFLNIPVVSILTLKLLVHPMLMFLAMYWTPGIDPVWKTTAVIMASLPMIGIYPAFANRYGYGQEAATAALPTNVISLFTTTVIIWFLLDQQPFGPLIY